MLRTDIFASSPNPAAQQAAVTVGENTMPAAERDNGRTFTMNRRDILDVKPEGIPGTGYSRRLVHGKPARGELQKAGQRPPSSGGAAIRGFRFRALAGGKAAIEFRHKRARVRVCPGKTFPIRAGIRSTPL